MVQLRLSIQATRLAEWYSQGRSGSTKLAIPSCLPRAYRSNSICRRTEHTQIACPWSNICFWTHCIRGIWNSSLSRSGTLISCNSSCADNCCLWSGATRLRTVFAGLNANSSNCWCTTVIFSRFVRSATTAVLRNWSLSDLSGSPQYLHLDSLMKSSARQ